MFKRVAYPCLGQFHTSFPFLNSIRYAKMDRYKFLKQEEEKTQQMPPIPREKKKRRVIVSPAGMKEFTPNPVPPKLRDQPIPEEFDVPIDQQKSLSIALIGPPNVGKSSLLNKILQDHVAATSSKAQTTRLPIVGFRTIENTQLVFLDTPGIVERTKQKQISRSIVTGSWSVLDHADIGSYKEKNIVEFWIDFLRFFFYLI